MSDKWTWETAHLSPGAGVVVVKKIDGVWHTFAMWARGGYDMPLVDSFKQSYDDLTGQPPSAGSYRFAFPISLSERNANPNIVQNYGY